MSSITIQTLSLQTPASYTFGTTRLNIKPMEIKYRDVQVNPGEVVSITQGQTLLSITLTYQPKVEVFNLRTLEHSTYKLEPPEQCFVEKNEDFEDFESFLN